jgi:hypothetical protein
MDKDGGLDAAGAAGEVASVFGQPYRSPSGTLLIPVARVVHIYRSGAAAGLKGEPVRVVTAAPRAVIEVDENGVRIKEITNPLVLGLAGITLVAWNVFWITKTIRAFARKS